jgi:hypothetical protein
MNATRQKNPKSYLEKMVVSNTAHNPTVLESRRKNVSLLVVMVVP